MFTAMPPSSLWQRMKRSPNTRVSSLTILNPNAPTYHSAVRRGSDALRWMWLIRQAMGSSSGFSAQEIAVLAFHHQLLVLVVDGDAQHHDARRAAGLERGDGEHRVERVARIDRLQKARRLIEEGDQRIAHHVGKDAGAGRALHGHQEPVRQEIAVAARPAVGPVLVDGMVVAGGQLKRREES